MPEIAATTGHALKEVESILDAHYLARDGGLAENTIRKREEHEAGTRVYKTNDKTPTWVQREPFVESLSFKVLRW